MDKIVDLGFVIEVIGVDFLGGIQFGLVVGVVGGVEQVVCVQEINVVNVVVIELVVLVLGFVGVDYFVYEFL